MQPFATLRTAAHQVLLSVGFSRQEPWSGLSFSSPRDLPNPGVEPGLLLWQADSLPLSHQGNPEFMLLMTKSLLVRKELGKTVSLGRKCCDQDLKDIRVGMGSSTRGTGGSQGKERWRKIFCITFWSHHLPESSDPHHIPSWMQTVPRSM